MGKHRCRAGRRSAAARRFAGGAVGFGSAAGKAAKGNRQAGKAGLGGEATEKENGIGTKNTIIAGGVT